MVGHSRKQLKQTTQRSKLISFDSEFIHSALHTVSQLPQASQSSSLILILNRETLDIKPRNVPRGHIVLQNNLPLLEDITIRTDNIIIEIKTSIIIEKLNIISEYESEKRRIDNS